MDNGLMPVLVSSPRFIGRREERGVLEAALTRAEGGAGSVVLVSGESGMGKSRLIGDFVATARAAGAIALIGECLEFADGELPYAPIAGALRPLLHENDTVAPDTAALEQLLAELTPGSMFERLVATLFDLSRRAPAVGRGGGGSSLGGPVDGRLHLVSRPQCATTATGADRQLPQ
jgi:hypothetical protein